jgi:hypothetical protein
MPVPIKSKRHLVQDQPLDCNIALISATQESGAILAVFQNLTVRIFFIIGTEPPTLSARTVTRTSTMIVVMAIFICFTLTFWWRTPFPISTIVIKAIFVALAFHTITTLSYAHTMLSRGNIPLLPA